MPANAPLKFIASFDISNASISRAQKKVSSALNSGNLPVGGISKFDSALGRVSTRASEFQRSMDAATARVFAFGAAVGVINAITQSFKALVAATVDVEKKLTLINSIFGASASEFSKFREDIFRAAQNTEQSFATVAAGATELARQGLSAAETAKRLNDALILTRLSGLDSAKSVETLTAAINGFSESGLTSTQILNKMVAVDNSFAVSSKDLAEGLARAGSTAQDAGVSFDELLGLVTAVQQRTARGGAVIGNAFKTIFARISRGGAIEDLKALGVEIDASQNGIEKLKAISRALESVSDPAIASQIRELAGGVFQLNVVSSALKDLASDQSIFTAATKKSAQASNEAYKQNAELSKTTASQFNELVVGITNVAAKIGDITLSPIFTNLLQGANKFVEFLNQKFSPENGNSLFKSFFSGIANFLSGPGFVVIGLAFARILQLVGKFAKEGLKELLSISDVSKKNANIQREINILLENDERLRNLILSSAVSIEQKERALLTAISQGNLALAKRAAIVKALATSTIAAGITQYNPKAGFVNKSPRTVPNFAQEYPGLREAILREVTGTGVKPSQVRVNQHSKFATRQNPSGIVVTNTRDEPGGVKDIPNFALTPEQRAQAKAYIKYKEIIKSKGIKPKGFKGFSQAAKQYRSPSLPPTSFAPPYPAKGSLGLSNEEIRKRTSSLGQITTPAPPVSPVSSPGLSKKQRELKSSLERSAAVYKNTPLTAKKEGLKLSDQQIKKMTSSLESIKNETKKSSSVFSKVSPNLKKNLAPLKDFSNAPSGRLKTSTDLLGLNRPKTSKDIALSNTKSNAQSIRENKLRASALAQAPNLNPPLARPGATSPFIYKGNVRPPSSLNVQQARISEEQRKRQVADFAREKREAAQLNKEKQQARNREVISKRASAQSLVAQGASMARRPSIVKPEKSPFLGISDKSVSRYQGAGAAMSSLGLAAAFGLAPIQNALISSKGKGEGVTKINREIESLTKQQDKARESGDEKAVAEYDKKLEESNRKLKVASDEVASFSKRVNGLGAALTAAAFIIPQLLAAGGNASRIGAVGGTALAGVALGAVLGELLKKLVGFDKILDSFVESQERAGDFDNEIALIDSAKVASDRLKVFEKRLSIASDILNKQFSATVQKSSIQGIRSQGQVAFDRVGVGGIRSRLSLGESLNNLADEYLPDDKKTSLVDKTARDGQIELAKISLDIKDNFNTLASSLSEVSFTGSLAQKQLESYEKAFKTTIGKNPLEGSLKQFSSQTQQISPDTSPDIALKSFLADQILALRKGIQESPGAFAEGANKQVGLTVVARRVEEIFGQLSSGGLTNEKETELITSLLDTASAADKLAEQIGKPANLGSFSDLVNRQLEARAQLENSLLLAEKQQVLEELSAKKKLQDDFVSKLKETFQTNLENIPFDPSNQFPKKSSPAELGSFLQSLGLDQIQSAGVIEASGRGNIFSPDLIKTGARNDLLSTLSGRSQFTAPGTSNLSEGERGLIKQNVDLAAAEKNISSILGTAGVTSIKDFTSFFDSIKKGIVNEKTLGLADTGLGKLENLQGRGRIGEDEANQIATTLAGIIQSIAATIGVTELPRAQVAANVATNQVQDAANEVRGLAGTNINTAMADLDKIGLSLAMKFETVTQSVLSSSESVATALTTAANRIVTATADLLNNVPSPTRGAVAPQPTPAGGS